MTLKNISFKEDHIRVQGDFRTVSSAPFHGGVKEARDLLNFQVQRNFREDVDEFCNKRSKELGFDLENSICLMTSCNVQDYSFIDKGDVKVITTAGVSGNTINTIILLDYDLMESAMVNSIIVSTEAKTKTLMDIDARKDGEPVTGTVTDATVVACYGEDEIEYSGKATNIGKKVYSATQESIRNSLRNYGLKKERALLKRLEERNIGLNSLVESAFELSTVEDVDLKEEFRKEVQSQLRDKNIQTLFEAVFRLRDFKDMKDTADLVSDEMIGLEISEYIYGRRAFFNFVRYDKQKPGILSELGPFLDDAIAALIGGCMTKVFSKRNQNR